MFEIHEHGRVTLLRTERSVAEDILAEINREAAIRNFPLEVKVVEV